MGTWESSFQAAIAKRRYLKNVLGGLLPETLRFEILSSFHIHLDPQDKTGPSYYVLFGGPAAFYHYEEAEKAEVLQGLPEDGVFFDVGANVGLFSFFVGRYFPQAKIYAFEPHPKLFRCLQATRLENSLNNVFPVQACMGKQNGRATLYFNRKDSGGHSTHADQIRTEDHAGRHEAEQVSLDSFISAKGITRLDVLKVDVQGAEWQVLEGARESIRKHRPKIVIELDNEKLLSSETPFQSYFRQSGLENCSIKKVGSQDHVTLAEFPRLVESEMKRGALQTNYVIQFT